MADPESEPDIEPAAEIPPGDGQAAQRQSSGAEKPPTADEAATPVTDVPVAVGPASAETKPRDLTALPNYSRSLLKISVPVSVQLAGKKESIHDVIALAPGSIIKFEKGCEELLQMIVGEHTIAEGEAVKIGEKFGFRVSIMKLPPEHFAPLKKPRRA